MKSTSRIKPEVKEQTEQVFEVWRDAWPQGFYGNIIVALYCWSIFVTGVQILLCGAMIQDMQRYYQRITSDITNDKAAYKISHFLAILKCVKLVM